MEVRDFTDKKFSEIPVITGNPAFDNSKCFMVCLSDCGKFWNVLKITPNKEDTVTRIAKFWDDSEALEFTYAYVNKLNRNSDEKKVYDRRKILKIPDPYDTSINYINLHVVFIGNEAYPIFYNKSYTCYNREQLEKFDMQSLSYSERNLRFSFTKKSLLQLYDEIKNSNITLNSNLRKPVLVKMFYDVFWKQKHILESLNEEDKAFVPLLTDFDFHKVLTDKEVYIKIETFLGWLNDNPELEDNQTDEGKIESHGFDKKISFRHRK